MCGQQLIVVPSPGDGEAELGDVVNAAQEVARQRETGRVSENNILNISGQGKHNLSSPIDVSMEAASSVWKYVVILKVFKGI